MERYEVQNNYKIVNISRSPDALSIKSENPAKEIRLRISPFLVLDAEKKLVTAILSSCFVSESNDLISNELTVKIIYEFLCDLPVARDGDEKVKIQNYADLLSVFDTTIGTFRGILFEWLKKSSLQRPLPFIDIEEFIKDLRISFSK